MPSPIVAVDLISSAYRKIGAMAAGETPNADEASVGLRALNDVIETWNLMGMALIGTLPDAFTTVAGTNTYNIGVGGTWNGQRPVSILGGYCTVSGLDYPISIWTLAEWMNEPLKSMQQPIIEKLAYVNDYPLGKVILWPTPSAAITVTLDYATEIAQVASTATTLTLAPAYARALTYATAVELQAEFGGQDVSAYATATMAVLKRANRNVKPMSFDPAVMGDGAFIGVRGY